MYPQVYQRKKKLQQQIRVSLKVIETLSYDVVEVEKLQSLLMKCKDLEEEARRCSPKSEGLILQPKNTSLLARKIKLKYLKSKRSQHAQKYSSLVKKVKSGRPRQSATFRNRFGRKANLLRKVYTHDNFCCIPATRKTIMFYRKLKKIICKLHPLMMTNY